MKRRQQGQVLPLGLAMLALTLMGVFVLYNTGQIATDKMKLANAADAAAYSGSLWQARALNFQAYSNRAMVANQVSIAQAVTLQSWVTYGAVTSENIATVLQPVPILNVVAQGVQTGLQQVERIMSPIAGALLNVVDVVNKGLSVAQEAMFVSTFVATPDVINSVVAETDDRFSASSLYSGVGLAKNLVDWRSFTSGYSKNDTQAMSDRVDMINQSRDPFTAERNWKFFKNFWFYSTPITRHRLYREGATELIQVERDGELQWEWKAKDTLSLHNRLWRWRGTKRYEIPVGWGEAFANSESTDNTIDPTACSGTQSLTSSANCSRFLGMNRTSEAFADAGVLSPFGAKQTNVSLQGYNGINAFRSLSDNTLDTELPRVRLKIEVSMAVDDTRQSDGTDIGDSLKAPVTVLGDVVSSISTAEVYYQRADANLELAMENANGYSPYWAARLAPVEASDKALAISFRAGSSTAAPSGLSADNSTLARYPEPGFELSDLDGVVASQNTALISRYEHAVRDELTQPLASAVSSVISGMAGDDSSVVAAGSTLSQAGLENATQLALSDLTTAGAEQPYIDAVQGAEQIAADLKDEFLRIQSEVSDNFEIAQQETNRELDEQLNDTYEEISILRERLETGGQNDEGRRDIERQIQFYFDQSQSLREGLRETLALQLIDIVSEATDLYAMPYSEALFTVDEWLRVEDEQIQLPWAEVFDEE